MGFLVVLAQRTLYGLLLLLAVLVLNFTMINLAPGDVVDTIAADMGGASAELVAQIRAEYGWISPSSCSWATTSGGYSSSIWVNLISTTAP